MVASIDELPILGEPLAVEVADTLYRLPEGPFGDRAPLVDVCAAADCSMPFVRHHHRRRWCHDGCSHRDRQARYQRRHRQRSVA